MPSTPTRMRRAGPHGGEDAATLHHRPGSKVRVSVIPPGQQALRDRCAHPTGAGQPFPPAESQVSAVARFEAQARVHAGRPAISVDGRQVTYAELDATANRVANALLREAGDRAEPVALLFEHGAPMIAALLGVLKAGKFYVALSLQDPPARQAQILGDSTARLIVCDAASAPLARRLPGTARVLELDALVAHGAPALRACASRSRPTRT